MEKISRFVFNFRHSCNMNCSYCYIPFIDKESGDITLWKSIVDKIAEFSPDIVTFGGGDPFAYGDFTKLINYCCNYPFQIQVDTNAIGLTRGIIKEIYNKIHIIGVPLDGNEHYHDSLRKFPGHYGIIRNALDVFFEYNLPTKINTVVIPGQEKQLYNIARFLQKYHNIKQWFIYEYWHFDSINKQISSKNNTFCFDNEYCQLKEISNVDYIHYSTVSERTPAYVFVSSLGNLYTIDDSGERYVEIANIFDKDAKSKLVSIRNKEEIRIRAKLKEV